MKNRHRLVVETLAPIHDTSNAIYIDTGVKIFLDSISIPMFEALRKKYLQDRRSLKMSKKARRYLFIHQGFTHLDEADY